MSWSALLLLLPHFKPKCINYLSPTLGLVIDACRIFSLLVAVALYVQAFLKEKKYPSLPTWLLGIMEGWIFLITIRNGGDFVQVCSLAVSIMALALIVDLYSHRMKELLIVLMFHYEWMVYANLYTVWKWPDQGMVLDTEYNVPIYFFGPDNWFMYLCIPAICVALIYLRTQWNGKWRWLASIRTICLIFAAYACVYLQWPATAVAAMAVLAVVLLIGFIPLLGYCVSFPMVLLSGIAANLAIVVFRVMETIPQISDFIQNVLKKDITLSGRTQLWDGFWPIIRENLITGIGIPKEGYVMHSQQYGIEVYDHMHNIIFDLLIQGGIPALLLFLLLLLLVGKELTVYAKTPTAKIMTAAMAGLLVMCIPEVCRHSAIFLIFPLAYYVGNIEQNCTENSETD